MMYSPFSCDGSHCYIMRLFHWYYWFYRWALGTLMLYPTQLQLAPRPQQRSPGRQKLPSLTRRLDVLHVADVVPVNERVLAKHFACVVQLYGSSTMLLHSRFQAILRCQVETLSSEPNLHYMVC